ncbi:hypothetical protein [Macrococcoides canis]|uniref:hypothetical protein n=1 Tax=Macrococcoides canis TaxID=1855823 RepID=UPI0020B6F65D|nr:hypothetical protein [Macrococcus canis]WBF52615.1 hypothetical protein LL975_11075 [Macrococcus canis]
MIIESFSILDFKTKEARTFDFQNGTNLIISNGNTEGKSSLLKSLYYTLGFDVRQFPSGWSKDDMYFQVRVNIENQRFNITRQKNSFRVSDSDEIMDVKDYSEWLSEKLNIHMELPNVYTKSLSSAYSSALILPFYIDQDDSWEGVLYRRVTDTLNQYSGIPQNIFESIFSLSDEEVTQLRNDITNDTSKKNSVESTITSFFEIVEEYKKENEEVVEITKIDKKILKTDIDKYLRMLNDFNTQVTSYKMKLLNKQELLDLQQQELIELEKLLEMNKNRYSTIKSECNYCHSKLTKEKSLTRLDLSNNFYEISILKDTVEKEISKLRLEIDKLMLDKEKVDEEIDALNERIQKSEELLTIDEYVKAAARTEAINEMENLIEKQVMLKVSLEQNLKKLRKRLTKLNKEKKDLRKTIETRYSELITNMKTIFSKTNLNELDFLKFKKIDGSGIDKNKKYLAYYLIYFNLLREYGKYTIPFCMDSFIKNEISGDNAVEMFGAIEKYFFDNDNQSFFSIVSENLKHFENIEEFNQIEVNGKLLLKENYDKVSLRFHFE